MRALVTNAREREYSHRRRRRRRRDIEARNARTRRRQDHRRVVGAQFFFHVFLYRRHKL